HDSEQNATTFMNLALLGVLWEGYLWLSSPRSSRAENDNTIDESNVEFALQPDIISKKYEFKVVYKF
ncbi:hypothetical protein KKA14_13730, partial [bacterium]|nr:hypothetical protein [bacterium]